VTLVIGLFGPGRVLVLTLSPLPICAAAPYGMTRKKEKSTGAAAAGTRILTKRAANSRSVLFTGVLMRILRLVREAPDRHNEIRNGPAYRIWSTPTPRWTRVLLTCRYLHGVAM
jgi:hypothetical protein